MKVAWLTHHLPYPPISGGRRREYELIRRLADDYDVEIHLRCVSKVFSHDELYMHRLNPYCATIQIREAKNKSIGFHCSHVTRHKLASNESNFTWPKNLDLIHIEGYYVAQHHVAQNINQSNIPTLLVEHNLEYKLHQQRRENLQARWCEADERRAWRQATALGAVTDDDACEISNLTHRKVLTLPDGITPVDLSKKRKIIPGLVVMVANYAYKPNLEGAIWLLKKVWPRVIYKVPSARLMLVGSDPPASLSELAQDAGAEITGRVISVDEYLDEANVVVVPLLSGGGVKVKTLEAIAHGKAIVSTHIGVQGLSKEAKDALKPLTSSRGFASEIVYLLTRDKACREREQAAELLAENIPTWDEAAEAVFQAWRTLKLSKLES